MEETIQGVENQLSEFIITAKAILRVAETKTSKSRAEIAADAMVSIDSLGTWLSKGNEKLLEFINWFKLSGAMPLPDWPDFTAIVDELRQEDLPFLDKKSPDYTAQLKCVALKTLIGRFIREKSPYTIAQVADILNISTRRMYDITSRKDPALPSWEQWFKICALLRFPTWEAYFHLLKQEARELVAEEKKAASCTDP